MTKFNADLAHPERPRTQARDKTERIPASHLARYKTEDEIQIEVAQYLDRALPAGWRWFHPPNGGWRKLATAKRLKAMGVKAGIPDIVILRPKATPIYIELKSFGGVPSKAQAEFRDWCTASESPFCIARSRGEVEVFLREFVAKA